MSILEYAPFTVRSLPRLRRTIRRVAYFEYGRLKERIPIASGSVTRKLVLQFRIKRLFSESVWMAMTVDIAFEID